MADPPTEWQELSFLVRPNQPADWRMVLLYDAAVETGLLDALPGHPAALSARLDLHQHAVRVVLDGLAVWGIVEGGVAGVYTHGPDAPGTDARAVLRHHAQAIRDWSAIPDRLRGKRRVPTGDDGHRVEIALDALAVVGRKSAPAAVDACLSRVPDARRVLDLGGGHGQFALEFARRGLQVTMQDRAEVIDLVRLKGWLVDSDVELFAGDFFETVPDGPFDIVFCAGVVHTLDGERTLALLRRVHSLMAEGGLLAIHTILRGTDDLAALFAPLMLALPGVGNHGEDELRDWLDKAGYKSAGSQRLQRRPGWMLFGSPITG